MITSTSLRVQRHSSQVSVRRGKFYLLTVMSHRVSFAPTERPGRGVVGQNIDPLVRLTWYPQISPIMKCGIEKNNGPLCL